MPRKTVVKKQKLGPSLFLHKPTGQWTAKFNGKFVYFGKDPDEALRLYQKELPVRQAGRDPQAKPQAQVQNPTVGDVVNRFLSSKRRKMESGELSPVSWRDYHSISDTVVHFFGKTKPVLDLNSTDFEKLRVKLSKSSGPFALANWIQKIRTIFKYAFDADMIDRPVRFGPEFKKPSRSVMRKTRNASPKKLFSPEEVRTLIENATSPVRAMILLGINAGYGQSDIAGLRMDSIDFKSGWIDYPRGKTGVNRRCHLWPETVSELKAALKNRPTPKDPDDNGLAFVTRCGKRWVRVNPRQKKPGVHIDSVRLEFGKLLDSLKIKRQGLGFYALRHTFRTVADEVKDQPAANFIMGHVDEHISGDYREEISDARLKAITDFVRQWLGSIGRKNRGKARQRNLSRSKAQ